MPAVGAAFPPHARLKRATEFRRVFAGARKSADAHFTVLARPNGQVTARLGLAISRKCAIRAIGRNRIKRLVRESFRHARSILVGLDIVVLCRPSASNQSNQALFASLQTHWQRLRKLPCNYS